MISVPPIPAVEPPRARRVLFLPAARRTIALVTVAVVFLGCFLSAAKAARAAQAEVPREYQIKAAFLYNFIKYVQWAGSSDSRELTIGVLGKDPFGSTLNALRGKTVNGRTIVIRNAASLQEARRLDVVFISASERERLKQILDSLRDAGVLTVGETKDFARTGGIINFTTDSNKVRFEINPDAAERSRLKISSQLLRLAKVVRG